MSKSIFAAVAALALSATAAQAVTVYSEDFNSAAFQGTEIFPTPNSDPYVPTFYYSAVNNAGWSFSSGSTFVAVGGSPANGAILLNENAPAAFASRTVTGLTANALYTLSFDLWGDNRPGQTWVLNVSVNGGPLFIVSGVDQLPGTFPGAPYTFAFSASSTGTASLLFTQASPGGSEASPIFDNVTIADATGNAVGTTPLPAALPLFASGLGAMGFLGWRRKRKAVAA